MAASVYENIRLDASLTDNLPTSTYKAVEIRDENVAHTTVDYSITGTPHVHRSSDTSGDIVQHRHHHYKLLLTQAEYLVLRELIGKVLYFMPHIRDESNYAVYRETVVLEMLEEEIPLIIPTLSYFTTSITLRDATGWTVDA